MNWRRQRGLLRAATAFGAQSARPPALFGAAHRPPSVAHYGPSAGFGADPAEITFVKERGIPRRRLFAVNAVDDAGQPWHHLVAVEQHEDTGSWAAHTIAGGWGSWGQHDPEAFDVSEPEIELAGSWGDAGYYGGGRIYNAGADVAHVRATFANALRLEDDAEGDVTLFLTDQPVELPITLELIDPAGRVLARRVAYRGFKPQRHRQHRRGDPAQP